ncbi:MAG: hypothetical protein NZ843_01335, partial [Fimbriimonadales bacterium]|nr:hypothetical protein [Fimbriimonadales bacterium]
FAKGLHKAQRWVGAFTLTPAEYGYRRAIGVSWEPAFPARTTPAPAGAQASEVQRGLELVHRVRAWMDACGRREQPLVVLGDGAYSARAFVQGPPSRTWAMVRLRADVRLCALPEGGGVGVAALGVCGAFSGAEEWVGVGGEAVLGAAFGGGACAVVGVVVWGVCVERVSVCEGGGLGRAGGSCLKK